MTAGESQEAQTGPTRNTNWLPLVALAIAQFVMVLDQSAMNVSISALVADFDTTPLSSSYESHRVGRRATASLAGAASALSPCAPLDADLPKVGLKIHTDGVPGGVGVPPEHTSV